MKALKLIPLLLIITAKVFGQPTALPLLQSVTITFYTPAADDKDWDTKVTCFLYDCDDNLIATTPSSYNQCTSSASSDNCFCCVRSSTYPAPTTFPDGSRKGPFGFEISRQVSLEVIKHGYIKVTINPNGNDRWVLEPTIQLKFSDGTSKTITGKRIIVAQDAPDGYIPF